MAVSSTFSPHNAPPPETNPALAEPECASGSERDSCDALWAERPRGNMRKVVAPHPPMPLAHVVYPKMRTASAFSRPARHGRVALRARSTRIATQRTKHGRGEAPWGAET